ncbi:CbiX/SirB N-terminal domain-containing protein [Paenibacillus sediminis]|uniref:Sirohydrochlorin ferrochelatase n=1 Tax=Paenibacillus sediminis TaxID=664909 RepID=A0ABS4H555_9BACL|nr:CbiX/SirB N-terminal domain-containing protein [Paenibacillus sediminis]MBP1937669.1 sirohydrochlorin ferrochelatase [Paenibacillus sediminis]
MNKPGVLIISHGSRESSWVTLVDEAVTQLEEQIKQQQLKNLQVEASFLELVEGRLIQDGIRRLEEQGVTDIFVIPLFVSSGSTHVDEIAYALGVKEQPELETDLERFDFRAHIHYGKPVDDDAEVAQMIWDKVKHLSARPDREVIVIVGHGSRYDWFRQRWVHGISSLAERVQHISGVAYADYGLLNPESVRERVEYWSQERGYTVIVAPLFLSEGYFLNTAIPDRLRGLSYQYAGKALLPHPFLPKWTLKQIRSFLNERQYD